VTSQALSFLPLVAAAGTKAWLQCAEETNNIRQEEFDANRVAVLRGIVCGARSDGPTVAAGMSRHLLSDRSDFTRNLARALLGEDGKPCAAASGYDAGTRHRLR